MNPLLLDLMKSRIYLISSDIGISSSTRANSSFSLPVPCRIIWYAMWMLSMISLSKFLLLRPIVFKPQNEAGSLAHKLNGNTFWLNLVPPPTMV